MDIDLAFDFKYQEVCLLLQLHPKYILRFFTESSQVMKKVFFFFFPLSFKIPSVHFN